MRCLKEACVSALETAVVPFIRKRLRKHTKDRLVRLGTHIVASILKHRMSSMAAKMMLCMAVYRNKGHIRMDVA